jgi:nucleoside-diphosphate-sugar epimerase
LTDEHHERAAHRRHRRDAFRLAALRDVRGAFNVAADPVLGRRRWPTPAWDLARAAVSATFTLRLQRLAPGWVDLAVGAPITDSTRARTELGWQPRFDAHTALADLLGGMRGDATVPTPALAQPVGAPTSV